MSYKANPGVLHKYIKKLVKKAKGTEIDINTISAERSEKQNVEVAAYYLTALFMSRMFLGMTVADFLTHEGTLESAAQSGNLFNYLGTLIALWERHPEELSKADVKGLLTKINKELGTKFMV